MKGFDAYGQLWSKREYIVVLDAYFKAQGQVPSLDSESIVGLTKLTGRTPASIVMRMENFASLDRDVTRKGLRNVSPECRQIFEEYGRDRSGLSAVADFLRGEMDPLQRQLFPAPGVGIKQVFRSYEIQDRLGAGAFGDVFSCMRIDTGKLFAVKFLRMSVDGDREAAGRFAREIRALRAISHPSIIRLFEENVSSPEECPAYVMELAESNLGDYVASCGVAQCDGARALLAPREALEIVRSILDAVRVLHGNEPKILHRDINPNNILRMEDGRWVLADFGLAKFMGRSLASLETKSREGLGTTYFTAPEQYADLKRVDERTDIYSLGVLIWELFSSETPLPRSEESGLPPPLYRVFSRATARKAAERYVDISEMRREFEQAAQECEANGWWSK